MDKEFYLQKKQELYRKLNIPFLLENNRDKELVFYDE